MENRADFKMLAKAYGRRAKAYRAAGELDNAVTFYDKALSNHRCADYLKPKQEVMKEKKEAEKRAYIDPEKAGAARAEEEKGKSMRPA